MTTEEAPTHSGAWVFPEGQDLGHAMSFISLGLGLYGLSTAGYPGVIIPALCLAVAAMIGQWSFPLWFKGKKSEDMDMMGDMGMGMGMGMYPGMPSDIPQHLWVDGAPNEDVQRLKEVVEATFGEEIYPLYNDFALEEGVLVAFKYKAVKPGYFTESGNKTRVSNKLTAAVPPKRGAWAVTFSVKEDTITATQKSSIPKLALPPLWHVSKTVKDSETYYKKFEMTLGPGEGGKMVTFKPQVFPHVAVIATSGGGKSVFLRACVEQMRAIGQTILGDGKGLDYATLRDQPGVVAIGRGSGAKGVEYIAAIELAFRIMQQRQNTAAERKAADPEGWEDVPPVFLILDELKSVLKKWSTELDKKSMKAIESKVNQILALGRQMRVHTYCASQDVYAESIPPSWLTNIGMKISLGKPHHLTINKGFDESIREEATRIAAGVDPNVRGRGMIAGMDEDTGTASVKSYQGFLSPSPGEATPGFLKGDDLAQWNNFKTNVTDAIPRLYSRKWFKIEEKPEAQVKMEASMGRELGYIDFELFSVDEISMLPIINLDMRDSKGNIVPDPEMVKYDPNPSNDEYVCRPVVSTENSITEI